MLQRKLSMSLYVPTGTPPLISSALARIERRLPYAGEVLVRQGQRVEQEEVVARAFMPGTPQIVNMARALQPDWWARLYLAGWRQDRSGRQRDWLCDRLT
jgi:hypothetical protein